MCGGLFLEDGRWPRQTQMGHFAIQTINQSYICSPLGTDLKRPKEISIYDCSDMKATAPFIENKMTPSMLINLNFNRTSNDDSHIELLITKHDESLSC
jgi:hypothetical protein